MLLAAQALNLFIAAALGSVAAALLLVARRRSESVLLGVFLSLVAVNFLAGAFPADARWQRVAYVALALDPLFLLLFVTAFPYRRRTLAVSALLVVVGGGAVISLGLSLLDPGLQIARATSLPHAFVIAELAVAYAAAWVLSLRSAEQAPTPQLAERAAWTVTAVGVAVVPRLGLLVGDFTQVSAVFGSGMALIAAEVAASAMLMGTALGAGYLLAPADRPRLRRAVRLVAFVALTLLALRAMVEAALQVTNSGPELRLAVPFGVRWLPFAAILLHGVLAYEVVRFDRASDRFVPAVGAAWLASLAGLAAASAAGGLGLSDGLALGLGTMAAAAAVAPGWIIARGLARSAAPSTRGDERRLHLYRAALEAAWARGPPSREGRASLERDRGAFGIGFEEARALEHVVASAVTGARAGAMVGEEVAPGLVIEAFLGQGAHGRVFAARRHPPGDRVVVKELRADGGLPAARRRLMTEVRALQRVSHPNIVRLLDLHVADGRQLLVMERVDGPSLTEALANGPLPPASVARIAADVLDALGAAHAAGVVHQDVKPANILLGSDGHAKLTDFGVAATLDVDPEAFSATVSNLESLRAMQGTLAYAAPERLGHGKLTPSVDLYAVGLVVYEALTGRPALDLRGLPLPAALEAVARPRIDFEALPAAWAPVLRRALEPDPARRFADSAEMRRALPLRP